jgi:hypothetical protein
MVLVETTEFDLVEGEVDAEEDGDDADREHGRGSVVRLKGDAALAARARDRKAGHARATR